MNEREKYLESIYGPCHTGEFETGTVVHFKDAITRVIHTAMIEWIASPISAGGRVPAVPMRYIMAEIDMSTGLPYSVASHHITDVVAIDDEPLLQECRWCGGYHEAQVMNKCPLRPKR